MTKLSDRTMTSGYSRLVEEGGDPWRCHDSEHGKHRTAGDACPEYGGEAPLRHRLDLDDRPSETEVCECDHETRDDQGHSGDSEIVRTEGSRKDHRDAGATEQPQPLGQELPPKTAADAIPELLTRRLRGGRVCAHVRFPTLS